MYTSFNIFPTPAPISVKGDTKHLRKNSVLYHETHKIYSFTFSSSDTFFL